MNETFLYELLDHMSVSGHEIDMQKRVIKEMEGVADKIITDYTGNVTCVLNPDADFKVMLAAHIDEIGLIITHIEDNGLLCVSKAGGIYPTVYPGHKVVIEGKNKQPIYGACMITREMVKGTVSDQTIKIDIGAKNKEEALQYIDIGTPCHLDTYHRELLNRRLSARAIDDRGCAFIILEALKKAKQAGCTIGVYATTTVGEETTMRGAKWASERIQPDVALAVDVTYATDYPGTSPAESGDVRLGGGPVICNSSICNRKVNQLLKDTANAHHIPYQVESFIGRTGTDGDAMHIANKGTVTALLSLPLRYMHAPCETCSLDDIEASIDLLAQFLLTINKDTCLDPFKD